MEFAIELFKNINDRIGLHGCPSLTLLKDLGVITGCDGERLLFEDENGRLECFIRVLDGDLHITNGDIQERSINTFIGRMSIVLNKKFSKYPLFYFQNEKWNLANHYYYSIGLFSHRVIETLRHIEGVENVIVDSHQDGRFSVVVDTSLTQEEFNLPEEYRWVIINYSEA